MNLRLVNRGPHNFILDTDEMEPTRRRFVPKSGVLVRPNQLTIDTRIEVFGVPVLVSTVLTVTSAIIGGLLFRQVFSMLPTGLLVHAIGSLAGACASLFAFKRARTKWGTRARLAGLADNLSDPEFIHPAPPGADTSHLRLRSRSRLLTPISDADTQMIRELEDGEAAMAHLVRLDRLAVEIDEGVSARMKLRDDDPVAGSVDAKLKYLRDETDEARSELDLMRNSHRIEVESLRSLDNQNRAQKWLDSDMG